MGPGPGPGSRSPGFPTLQRVPTNGPYARRELAGPMSPDHKRRRFNSSAVFAPTRRDVGPESPYPYAQRRASVPRPEFVQTPRTFSMGPPPRPPKSIPSPHDPSLTLPPIQTSAIVQQREKQSVEAMVMSIPFINKIKVLSKITPPLAKPGPASPAYQIRGAIIAIEGLDIELVKKMVTYLESILAKTDDPIASIKIFPGPEVDTSSKAKDAAPDISGGSNMADATVNYLEIISTWHKISNSAAEYITTPLPQPFPQPTTNTTEPDSSDSVSTNTIIPKTESLAITSPTSSAKTISPLPIALIPRYQLTTSDYHAVRIPINDAYSPFDHWQWMATLWRGCVGPDMTVYVRVCERDEFERAGGGGVEVRPDTSVLVVRVVKDKEGIEGFEDRVLRRLGFEVEEWVRGRREGRASTSN
jgi:HMG box factor